MIKCCFTVAFLLAAVAAVFGGGEAETGRSTAAEQVSQGQLLPVGAIDPGNYLSDFKSDITNVGTAPLVVKAAMMQDRIWEKGGLMAFRILLAANEESFFRPTPGLFVLFFQNPELLRNPALMDDLATLIMRYYLPMNDSWAYLQRDLVIEYVGAGNAGNIVIDPMIELDTIIQNTPLVMLEAARLVKNNRNYLLALKLLQAQIALLRKLGPVRRDTAVDEDIHPNSD